jgi:hypothetical protein
MNFQITPKKNPKRHSEGNKKAIWEEHSNKGILSYNIRDSAD